MLRSLPRPMRGLWWKLPVLRRLSPMSRGLLEAFNATLAFAFLACLGLNTLFSDAPGVSAALAQIDATLLVAYAVQMSWVLQNSRKRGKDRENWVGVTAGLGTCSVIGIGLALALSSHPEPFTGLRNWLSGGSLLPLRSWVSGSQLSPGRCMNGPTGSALSTPTSRHNFLRRLTRSPAPADARSAGPSAARRTRSRPPRIPPP